MRVVGEWGQARRPGRARAHFQNRLGARMHEERVGALLGQTRQNERKRRKGDGGEEGLGKQSAKNDQGMQQRKSNLSI